MQTFSQFALSGTILASAAGAVVLCTVLLLYGLKSEPDDERAPGQRLLVIRVGHALAAACFAAALMLSTVALIDQRRIAASPPPTPPPDVRRLQARIAALEQRLDEVEAPRAVAGSTVAVETPRAAPASAVSRPRRAASAPARRPPAASEATQSSAWPSMRESGEAMPPRSASTELVAASPPTSAPSSADRGSRIGEDWDTVKRGFREAGHDIRDGFVQLGRRIKQTFN